MTTHLLVSNPTAQSGKNAARIKKARQLLEEHDIKTDLLATKPHGQTIPAVTDALDSGRYRCAIAMGGDGTFREVAIGILKSERNHEISLALLPTGTANDQGRSFGLSSHEDDIIDNAAVIAQGHHTKLDAGVFRAFDQVGHETFHTYFFDSAGWGLSAKTLKVRNQDRDWVSNTPFLGEIYRDHLLYAGALLKTFAESYVIPDKFSATVTADGIVYKLENLTDLIVKNTRVYAGAWVLDRRSQHDDGVFEVVPFRGRSDWLSKGLVDLDGNPITEEMLNTIGIEHSKPFKGGKLEFSFDPHYGGADFAAQLDGEEIPATPRVTIDVIPRAIDLIIP